MKLFFKFLFLTFLGAQINVLAQVPAQKAPTEMLEQGENTSEEYKNTFDYLQYDALGSKATEQAEEEANFKYEELRRFALVFANIRNRYIEKMTDREIVDAAIKGLMDDLDPHSVYLDAEDMADLQEETEGEFGGLGIEMGTSNGKIKIITPIEDTPASKSGLLPGDLITEINGQETEKMTLSEIVKTVRGEPGTKVNLVIERKGNEKPLEFNITRELIHIDSIKTDMIEDMLYIRISQFQQNSYEDLAKAILKIEKAPKAIILDVRNNPGGLLNSAVLIAKLFVATEKPIVTTKSRDGVVEDYASMLAEALAREDVDQAKLPTWLKTAPMVVLINVGSASASEIVAGAMQDFQRAKIIGNRSFGKGSVQIVLNIDDETGMKLTTSRYYTPKGRSIQALGITPDIQVTDTEYGDLFPPARESDLDDHLKNDNLSDKEFNKNLEKKAANDEGKEASKEKTSSESSKDTNMESDTKSGIVPPLKSKSKATDFKPAKGAKSFKFGSAEDFQLQQAINFLKGKPVINGPTNK